MLTSRPYKKLFRLYSINANVAIKKKKEIKISLFISF